MKERSGYRNGQLIYPISVTDHTDKGSGGSGNGNDIAPNSIGSNEIENGSIKLEDLSDEVKEGLDELNNITLTDDDIENIFFPQEG